MLFSRVSYLNIFGFTQGFCISKYTVSLYVLPFDVIRESLNIRKIVMQSASAVALSYSIQHKCSLPVFLSTDILQSDNSSLIIILNQSDTLEAFYGCI